MSLSNSSAIRLSSQVYPAWMFRALVGAEKDLILRPRRPICEYPEAPLRFANCPSSNLSNKDTDKSYWVDKPLFSQRESWQRRRSTALQQQNCKFSTTKLSPHANPTSTVINPSNSPTWTPPINPSIRPVAIIGAGVLGRRLAALWASTGRPVIIHDASPSVLSSARIYIADSLSNFCSENNTHPGYVHFSTSIPDAVQNAWMVIEAVPEDLSLKTSLLGRLDRLVSNDCILATASSTYKSRELVEEVRLKERVLNTLYYIPPRNRCVEIMGCGSTSPALFGFLKAQMEEIHLRPKIARNESEGLILPRIWGVVKRECLKELQEGVCEPNDIDELFRDFFGAKKGPCEKMDEIGLDTVAGVERRFLVQGESRKGDEHLKWLEKEFIEKGRLGDKSGDGLYQRVKHDGKHKEGAAEVWREHAIDLSGM